MSNKTKKLLILNLPYFIAGLVCTNLGEAWRIAEGADMSEKLLGFLSALGAAFSNPMPSLHPLDLLIGVCCGAGLRLAVYLKGKNAKKYRHGMEYGSARWGTQKDIEPFEDPVFANNVILTRTERLMMGNRPKNPANARNKNVLVVGGSGSGKTRFWLKPNLLQCHSSYVVTDPKGDIVIDCGQALLKNGYSIRIFNTINFRKSMHYNPFAYIHSEKDILKLTTTLIANTKGDGKAGDEFWTKAETLLYCALIGYILTLAVMLLMVGGVYAVFSSTQPEKSKAENVRDTTDQDYEKGLTEEQKAFNELINKQIYEETANNLEQYEQYGLTYNSDENQLFFNGKSVCYFADNRATDGTFEGTEVHSANGDIGIITERDRNGNITGLKQMEIPELTDFLEKSWKEK